MSDKMIKEMIEGIECRKEQAHLLSMMGKAMENILIENVIIYDENQNIVDEYMNEFYKAVGVINKEIKLLEAMLKSQEVQHG